MTIINPNSISGISSITALNSTAAINLFKSDGTAANIIAGVTTGTNFKTGSSNLHNVGIEIAGINVLGADTPIGAGSTIYNSGAAVFTGIVTTTNLDIEGGSAALSQLKINSTGRYRGVQLDENGTRKAHFQHDATSNTTVVGTAEGTMQFNSGDTPRVVLNSSGHWVPYADSTYDLGLTGTRWRNVYADTLYGDGSNITGITQTTINSNTNNYLITGTGTANTLQGESAATFDGSSMTITGSGTNLALNVVSGYMRSVGGQPTVVAHKSSSTFCHIGVEGNTNARAFLAYTNDKDFIIGRRTAYTGDHTGYSGADLTIDKTNHAVQLSYNGGARFVTTNEGATFSTGSSSCVVRLTSNNSSQHVLQAYNNDLNIKAPSSGGISLITNGSSERLQIASDGRVQIAGQNAIAATSLTHRLLVRSQNDSNAIAIAGRNGDHIGELSFYQSDASTRMGEIQAHTTHLEVTSRLGYLSLQAGGPTERVRIPSTGGIELKTDGRGIKFPDTQTPSNVDNNRVGISSEMRYYETGTFVPGLSSTVLNSLQNPAFTDNSYARRVGRYVRIGHLVHVTVEILMAGTVTYATGVSDSTTPPCITGVTPFYYSYNNRYAVTGQPDYYPCAISYSSSGLTNDTLYAVYRRDFPAQSRIEITKPGTGGSRQYNSTNFGEVFPANAHINVSFTYCIDTNNADY